MKNTSLLIAIVIAVLGCGFAVNAYFTNSTMRQRLQEERYKRMIAEEQMESSKGEVAKIRSDLAAAQKTLTSIQEIVNHGKDATSELKVQLEAIRKERDALKSQLEKIQVTTVEPAAAAD